MSKIELFVKKKVVYCVTVVLHKNDNSHVLNLREMFAVLYSIVCFFLLCAKTDRKLADVFPEFLIQRKVDLIWWFFLLAPGYLPCKNHFLAILISTDHQLQHTLILVKTQMRYARLAYSSESGLNLVKTQRM